jgi:hypothetical protein
MLFLFFITGYSLHQTPGLIVQVDVQHKDVLTGHIFAPRLSGEKWEGLVSDCFGSSEIFDFEMGDSELSFWKLEEESGQKIYYNFTKMGRDNRKTFWVGGWTGANNAYGFAEVELLHPSENFACGRQDLQQLARASTQTT